MTNDWQTAFCPAVAKPGQCVYPITTFKWVHVIHNLGTGYQGLILAPSAHKKYFGDLSDEDVVIVTHYTKNFSPTAVAIAAGSRIWTTVSPHYLNWLQAWQEDHQKWLLKPGTKWNGLVSGIQLEERQAAVAALKMTHAQAKAAVQVKYFGKADASLMLCVFVGRVCTQKGLDWVTKHFEALSKTLGNKLQVLIGGGTSGAVGDIKDVVAKMRALQKATPGLFQWPADKFFTDGVLALYGADFCLMPSRLEPCGLVQQEAMASGTPMIFGRIHGLNDTIPLWDDAKQTGCGFGFQTSDRPDQSFLATIPEAFAAWSDPAKYAVLRENAAKAALSVKKTTIAWANWLCTVGA